MQLSDKLVKLRKAKGISQLKLAEMMDVSRQAVSRWEVGTAVPSTDNLKYLGRLYDVPLEYLLHDDAPEPVFLDQEPVQERSVKDTKKKQKDCVTYSSWHHYSGDLYHAIWQQRCRGSPHGGHRRE